MHGARHGSRTSRSVSLSASLAALAVGVGLVATAPSATAAPPPDEYVAMGDSYSAGSGVLPTDWKAPLVCLRSALSYPKQVAAELGATLTDVTCGAAQTSDFAERQYRRVAPQLDALDEGTDLVTLTIGGNDNSTFIGAILACGAAGVGTLGHGNPCERAHGDEFVDEVEETTYPAIRQVLLDIQDRAPHARVAILGYPWILPAETGCFAKLPIARGDVPYLRDLQSTLNGVIERAADETGVLFVDLAEVSEGHDACAPARERWVEPLLFGTNTVPVHPNARGERAMGQAALTALGR